LQAWPILLGWPAVIVVLTLSVTGIIRKKPAWLMTAAIVVLPISLYLAATPRFRGIALVFPLLVFGAGIAVRHSKYQLAWLCLVPFVAVFAWLASLVINQ